MVSGSGILCPGPGHGPRDRSLSVKFNGDAFVVYSHAGDDWKTCKDHVKALLGISSSTPSQVAKIFAPDDSAAHRQQVASAIWRTSVPLRTPATNRQREVTTLGWRYFTERRGLHIGLLDDLSHCLRWHEGQHAIIALMTDAVTGEPYGVHRTYLNPDGTKRERKMLGRAGVIRLSPDEDVTQGLGICEGVEDGLAILISGWSPVWAATSKNNIANFPVLVGVECLTIFRDDDDTGKKAADACAARWTASGREVFISSLEAAQ